MLKSLMSGLVGSALLISASVSVAELPDRDQLQTLRSNINKELEGTYKRLRNAGGKCLDIVGPDLGKDGGRVHIWDCNDAPNQKWKLYKGRLKNIEGNKCLDVPGGPGWNSNGRGVQLWECNDAPNQQWRIDAQGRLVNGAGRCLDIPGGPNWARNGNNVQLWDCNGAPNQQWSFQ